MINRAMKSKRKPTEILNLEWVELQDFSFPLIKGSEGIPKITRPKQKITFSSFHPEAGVIRSSGVFQLSDTFGNFEHDHESLSGFFEIMGVNLLSWATFSGLGLMLGQYGNDGKCKYTYLAGDAFSWNRNPFNFQALESESIKKTGIGISVFCLGIGINLIFCVGIGI